MLTLRRTIVAFAAVLALGAVAAPSAFAQYDTDISFRVAHDGTSTVDAITRLALDKGFLSVVRQQVEIVHTPAISNPSGGAVNAGLPELLPGDEASFYADENLKLLARGTYAGGPQITNACLGATSFIVSSPGLELEYAGTSTPRSGGYGPTSDAVLGQFGPTAVTLPRPIAVGEVVYAAAVSRLFGWRIRSERSVVPVACPPPIVAPPAPTPAPAVPTDAAVRKAVKTATATTAADLRKHKQLAKLPFAFPEPGIVQLRLTAKGKTLGSGSKRLASAGKANVKVKPTSAGRKLLKRSKGLKLTLTATFTPSRANAKAQRAVVQVTLKR